jgi:DNA invertase Pin-like site-specific DNA recombinase
MTNHSDHQGIAYSYIRFSTPEQMKGDSLRRQTEAAADWCRRNHVTLDASTTLKDLGKSAFLGEHRKNADRYALAGFLKMVENGRIPRGSFLVVENLDRITREHVRAAVTLFLSILEQGISIVTTSPERVFHHDSSDMTDVIVAVIELARGHGESKVKSERVGQAWRQKKERARKGNVMTRMLPAWVEERSGRLVAIPERAAIIRRIFELCAGGHGHQAIIKKLDAEKVPAFGGSSHWTSSYVHVILHDRRVLGEYQPCNKRNGRKIPDGDVILNYYPVVVTPAQWEAARRSIANRSERVAEARRVRVRPKGGRIGECVNVFAGLITDARDGGSYFATVRNDEGGRRHVLINFASTEGRAKCHAFPLPIFETAILACLNRIDPREILGGSSGPDEAEVLAGELARVEEELASAAAFMTANGFSPTIGRRVAELENRQRELLEKQKAAGQRARQPVAEAWAEAKGILEALQEAADPREIRLRLRSALRRVVEDILILVVRRARVALCACQVYFRNDKSNAKRDYLIFHRQASGNAQGRTPEQWWCRSLETAIRHGDLELRKRADARGLERALLAVDLTDLKE